VQVGVLKRIFIVDIGDETGLREFINPEIIDMHGSVTSSEGCLSVPGQTGEVERPEELTIRALDRNGTSFELHATGFLAICICHEYDHLEGILFIDKVRGPSDSN
jgi:peptide deformylase